MNHPKMSDPNEAYRRQKILTASPMDLIIMLYDALKKSVVLGKRAIEKGDISKAHSHLTKGQEIVKELIYSLDTSYEISEGLFDIYEFIFHSLQSMNISKDTELAEPLLEIITELRDAWQVVADEQKGPSNLQASLG